MLDATAWTLAAIAAQARDRPGAPAVVDDDGRLTFGELWASAGVVATCLADFPGERVAIAAGRGRPFITAALGAGRLAGRAYIPLDMMNPTARLRLITEDSRPAVVMVSPETAGIGADLGVAELALPTSAPAAPKPPAPTRRPHATRCRADHSRGAVHVHDARPASRGRAGRPASRRGRREDPVAYVMYTSGTTGGPRASGRARLPGNRRRFMADGYGLGRQTVPARVQCRLRRLGDGDLADPRRRRHRGHLLRRRPDPTGGGRRAGRPRTLHDLGVPDRPRGGGARGGLLPPLRFMFFGGDRMVLPASPPTHPGWSTCTARPSPRSSPVRTS